MLSLMFVGPCVTAVLPQCVSCVAHDLHLWGCVCVCVPVNTSLAGVSRVCRAFVLSPPALFVDSFICELVFGGVCVYEWEREQRHLPSSHFLVCQLSVTQRVGVAGRYHQRFTLSNGSPVPTVRVSLWVSFLVVKLRSINGSVEAFMESLTDS